MGGETAMSTPYRQAARVPPAARTSASNLSSTSGAGIVSAPAASPDLRVRLLSAVNSMPPLPTVLNKLLALFNDENCSAAQIATLIEQDNVLSGSVLKCVNSAYYGVARRVSSIRHAVALLGFPTVRNLALAFSMRRMMSTNRQASHAYSFYSRHSLACALMTQFLAHCTRSSELEAAFAAGLFHDVGKVLIFTTVPDRLKEITTTWEASNESYEAAEQEVLGVTHSELSGVVLSAWKLPETIQLAARYHHQPESFSADEDGANLAWLVCAADIAVKHLGIETVSSPQRPPEAPEEAFETLGLGDQAADVVARFQSEFDGLSSAIG